MSSEPLWRQLEPNWPLIGLVTVSFFLGKWGFSVFLLPLVLYFALSVERRWREKAVSRELKEALSEEAVRGILLQNSTESAQWLNQTMRSAWPHLDRWLSSSTTSMLMRALVGVNQPDQYGKAKSVQFDVKYVSFGQTPIVFDGVTSKPATSPYALRLDLDFTFRGEVVVELEASIAFMKIPLIVNDLDMRGKLKLEMSFKDRGAIRLLSVSFLGAPTLNFAIKTMGKIDIMDLPTLKDTINTVIITYFKNSMTFPNAMKFDWSGPTSAPATPISEEELSKLNRKFVHQTVSAADIEEPPKPDTSSQSTETASATPDESVSDPLTPTKLASRGSLEPKSQTRLSDPKLSAPTASVGSMKLPSPGSSSVPGGKKPPPSQAPRASKTISSQREEDVNEFLLMSPEEFSGTLQVRVVECQKLPTSDIFTVSPYVVLETNGVTHRTIVVKRSADPVWGNALFEFPVPKFLPAKGLMLKVQVFDKTKIGDDDSLGHVLINLNRFLDKPHEQIDFWAPLVDVPSGKIRLQCKYISE
jgi:hypothetical protein